MAQIHPVSLGRRVLLAALSMSTLPAWGLIFYGTGDPSHNTTDPGNGSGWQWQIQYGNALATPIGADYMITARHVAGGVGDVFSYQGELYTTTASWRSPDSDLAIFKVDHPFHTWAELYRGADEQGKTLTVFGRGTQRGDPVDVTGASPTSLRGWLWGTTDNQMRWGQNVVSGIEDLSPQGLGSVLAANFDRISFPGDTTTGGGLAEEATLSVGDSGGGVFVQDGGVWKLAGLNYGVVTGWRFTPLDSSSFQAAVFDAGGLYLNGFGSIPDSVQDVSAEWVATRISSNLQWIDSVVPESTVPTWAWVALPAAAGLQAWRRRQRPKA